MKVFSDADGGADHAGRKSFNGYAFILGGSAVSCSSIKQSTTALSSVKAEYLYIAHAVQEVLWMKGLMQELGVGNLINYPVPINVDNQAAMFIAVLCIR